MSTLRDKMKQEMTLTRMLILTGKDITRCPRCQQGTLRRISEIPSKINALRYDTS